MDGHTAWPVILLGIVSTTQTHLAKALQRQGIETLNLLQARLRPPLPARSPDDIRCATPAPQTGKPLIYVIGLILNHTTFLYHLFVAPLGGTSALYTSMFGAGLIVLLLYSRLVMKERITRHELVGAAAILVGTLAIGIEGVRHPALKMAAMDLNRAVLAVLAVLGACLALLSAGRRSGSPNVTGLAFGLCAGTCGTLDPFLKGVGQTAGGGRFAPNTPAGWVVLAFSFLIGEAAVVITQWGFLRRARANILVPAYNCGYVALPVILQALLLPGYVVRGPTALALAAIMVGFVVMGAGRRVRNE